MITLPLGALVITLVLATSINNELLKSVTNIHALTIVLGGTFSILLLSTPLRALIGLGRSIRDLRAQDISNLEIERALKVLAQDRWSSIPSNIHPLISYAQILWEQGLEDYLFEGLLNHKIEELAQRTERPVTILRNLAKYPPALGMTGTVIGMISLFANLSSENKSQVGPNLALAMTATFLGLSLSNFVIMPLADRLQVRHVTRQKQNETVYKALLLINQNEPLSIIRNTFSKENQEKVITAA